MGLGAGIVEGVGEINVEALTFMKFAGPLFAPEFVEVAKEGKVGF